MVSEFVLRYSREGGHILDLFAGTGTVGEAAIAHKRFATLVEIDPVVVGVITRRLGGEVLGEDGGKIRDEVTEKGESLIAQLSDEPEVASIVGALPEEKEEDQALTQQELLQLAQVH